MTPAEIARRHEVGRHLRPWNAGGAPAAALGRRAEALLLTVGLFVVTLGVGWLAWSVAEWRHGRTASFRLTGLRVVRRSDGRPIGLCRSVVRNGLCCTVLLVPTLFVCTLLAVVFVMGASPPAGLLRTPRRAPWDIVTGTEVVDERQEGRGPGPARFKLGGVPEAAAPNMN
jgi:hypothetical protein